MTLTRLIAQVSDSIKFSGNPPSVFRIYFSQLILSDMSARPLSLTSLTKLTDDTCRAMNEQKNTNAAQVNGMCELRARDQIKTEKKKFKISGHLSA